MIPKHYYEQLINRLETKFMLLSIPFKIFLHPILTLSEAVAGTYLVKTGELQESITFIIAGSAEQQGPLKYFQKKKKPDYSVNWFWGKDDLVFCAPGFFSRQAAKHNVILREDSIVLQLQYEEFKILKAGYPEAEILIELVRDHYQELMANRQEDLRHLTHEELYENFKAEHKDILYNCSIYKLADYLGMSYRSFTRIHNKK